MKNLFFIISAFLGMIFQSCNENENSNVNIDADNYENFIIYDNISDMINAAHDYEDDCFEILSNDPLHIRISSLSSKEEQPKNIKDIVKNDIVYIAFQTFAKTNLNDVTITSIPMIVESYNPESLNNGKLDYAYKQTKIISRDNALTILKQYTDCDDFRQLYTKDEYFYFPNSEFDKLTGKHLYAVFSEL